MGEVYKAQDTRLERTVAIKLLPPHWAENTEMRQRFEREAQIVASLNHPNICVLHDVGQQDGRDFLVMEYLEGDTLAARLERGSMPWEEALKISIAIADALDKAHRQGVVHRDLKPSNIILTAGGPKLLDFGLAKLKKPRGSDSESGLATRTDITMRGAIIGTLQYMAPEQLEGEDTDARTDIFAFGVVLHEMITGKKAFEGKSRALLIGAIAASEPAPLSSVQPATPPALEHVVKTCMAKDPLDRWQTARDMLAELQWIAEAGADAAPAAARVAGRGKRARLWRVLPALAALPVVALAWPALQYFRGPQVQDEFRFRVPPATSAQPDTFTGPAAIVFRPSDFSVSPDGRTLAYVARANNTEAWSLYVRPIGSVTPRRIAGADTLEQPFWSGDSRYVGFVDGGKLKKIEASGGPPQDICEAASFSGGTWNREGTIVFGSATGLFRVSAEGGKPETLTSLEPHETGHFWPHFLPDGRHYLYAAWTGEAGKRAIFAGSLGSKDKTRVAAAESNAAYAEPGYMVFHRANALYAQPFHAGRLALAGEPARVADEVGTAADGRGAFAVSSNGVLAYSQTIVGATAGGGPNSDVQPWQLAWVDRAGGVLETVGPSGIWRGIEASPDGKRVAVHVHDAQGGDIWVIEPGGSVKRLTFEAPRHNSSPVWSPDGNRIVYSSLQKGKWGLYQNQSSGSGTEELLFESELLKAPMSWSPDGKRIVFWVRDPKTGGDLWVLPLDGDKQPAPLIASNFNETHGQISPDGKWIAYTSNSSGRNEVYVQPFPSGSGRWQISYHGGDWPRWKRDGKELFYHAIASYPDTPAYIGSFSGGPVLSAAVSAAGATLEAATPKEIVRVTAINIPHTGGDYQTYSVSADGQRILMLQIVASTQAATANLTIDPGVGLIVATHWTGALKK